jgi:hypothetical protein
MSVMLSSRSILSPLRRWYGERNELFGSDKMLRKLSMTDILKMLLGF